MTVICLAPLAVISALTLALLAFVPLAFAPAAAAFVANFSGSVGDLWMVHRMWQFRSCRDVVFVDELQSMTIHTSDPKGMAIAVELESPDRRGLISRLLLRMSLLSSAMLVAVVPLGIALSVLNAPDVTVGPARFPLVSYGTHGGAGLSISMDGTAIVVTALALAILSLPVSWHRRRTPSADAPPAPPRPAFL